MREGALRTEIEQLRVETAKLLSAKLDGGQGQLTSSFGQFSSPAASRAVNEKVQP